MMQGRVVPYFDSEAGKEKGIFIVLDAFALPVEGTETRVNAQDEAYEYMVEYKQRQDEISRGENVVGWYHSHPGYGCWLSGIDVETQRTNQTYQEPFLAIVVDPVRTVAAGKVELGAFRTLPDTAASRGASRVGSNSSSSSAQGKKEAASKEGVPLHKVEDFGVHANEYYALPVECFRSELDGKVFHCLWREYWYAALASSSEANFMTNEASDIANKLEKAMPHTASSSIGSATSSGHSAFAALPSSSSSRAIDAARGGARAAVEHCKGTAARAAAAEALGQ